MHPPGDGRGIFFEYCAAYWNPALALRMRAIGEEFQGERWRGAGSKCSGLRGRGWRFAPVKGCG